MNKRQRKKQAKRASARLAARLRDPGVVRRIGELGASFIRDKLRQQSVAGSLLPPRGPRPARPAGRWKDGLGIVHAVNALLLHGKEDAADPDVDLGRETACASAFWNPDEARLYPDPSEEEVDCMACIASRSCA